MKIISRKLNSKIYRTITHKGDIECGAWQTDGKHFEIKVTIDNREYCLELNRVEMIDLESQISARIEDTRREVK